MTSRYRTLVPKVIRKASKIADRVTRPPRQHFDTKQRSRPSKRAK